MRTAPSTLAAVAFVAAALPATARAGAPIGAHVACYLGSAHHPIAKRRAIDKPVTCRIEIDQGEPPPSAAATLTVVQDGRLDPPQTRTAKEFVPEDEGDGIYYPFVPPFAPGAAFKACKPFAVVGRIADGDTELWHGQATIEPRCRPAHHVHLRLGCHWDTPTTEASDPTPVLVCVLQTRNLHTKVTGDVGIVRVHGATDAPHVDTFADYPDDTYAVEARFSRAAVGCGGATVDGRAENDRGQELWSGSAAVPPCKP